MESYIFWNNKGGTGKTSLAFQSICSHAYNNDEEKVLVIDLCPQANLSELLLGGLVGNGGDNLSKIHGSNPQKMPSGQPLRVSIGGYFQERLPSPYTVPALNFEDFLCQPSQYNEDVPENIMLLPGDALVELQSNVINTLANTQIPTTNTWLKVIDWVRDYISLTGDEFDYVFIDANPSFSIYTQIALAAVDRVILPVMADDSSRRAIENAFALIHGINLPSPIYQQYNFAAQLMAAGRTPPKFHVIAKNRLTQYMGAASAYQAVLVSIDSMIHNLMQKNPDVFTFTNLRDGVAEIRDFQTTGVIAFAFGMPFYQMSAGRYKLPGRSSKVVIRDDYLRNCRIAMRSLTSKL
ncbi:ParA family protein [Aeromonas media]|uniref:ParA family protein n=1 Tax=Aeromonas media TaxID=651 RepID=UPI003D1CF1B4